MRQYGSPIALVCLASLVGVGAGLARSGGTAEPTASYPPSAETVCCIALPASPSEGLADIELVRSSLGRNPADAVEAVRTSGRMAVSGSEGHALAAGPREGEEPEPVDYTPGLTREVRTTCLGHRALAAVGATELPEWSHVPLADLPAPAREALVALGQEGALFDASGAPITGLEGTTPSVEARRCWSWYVCMPRPEGTVSWALGEGSSPPSPGALPVAPSRETLLWLLWPFAEAPWAQSRVDVTPGIHTLGALCGAIREQTEVDLVVDPSLLEREIACAAQSARVTELLWAVATAGGLYARFVPGPGQGTLVLSGAIGPEAREPGSAELPPDWLRLLVSSGYRPAQELPSVASFTMQPWPGHGTVPGGGMAVAWRLKDVPDLYRGHIEGRLASPMHRSEETPPLDRERAVLVWVWGIEVNVVLSDGHRGGRCYSAWLPAL